MNRRRQHQHTTRTVNGRATFDEPVLWPPSRLIQDNQKAVNSITDLAGPFPLSDTATKQATLISALDAFGTSAGIGPIGTNDFKPYFDAINSERESLRSKTNQLIDALKI